MRTAMFAGFSKEAIRFLASLKRNNRREWFQPRKPQFEQHVKAPMLELVTALNAQLARFAPDYVTDPAKALFRIYRDTRFSADKTPYKTHIAAWFKRRGPKDVAMGGFYFSISPVEIEIAGGLYHPPPDTTLLVRTHISENYRELYKILANQKVRRLMGELQGSELSRVPKGFHSSHPAVALIKKKDWYLDARLDSGVATSAKLEVEIVERFRVVTPLVEYLNRPLIAQKSPRNFLDDLR